MEKVRAVFKAGKKESFRRNKKEALSEKKQTLFVQLKELQEVLRIFIPGKHLKRHVLSVCLMA